MDQHISKQVYLARLKPHAVAEYRQLHAALSPELIAVYHEAGIRNLSCYLSGNVVVITVERDAAVAKEKAQWLATHPVERAWQAKMNELKEVSELCEPFVEICRLPSVDESRR